VEALEGASIIGSQWKSCCHNSDLPKFTATKKTHHSGNIPDYLSTERGLYRKAVYHTAFVWPKMIQMEVVTSNPVMPVCA